MSREQQTALNHPGLRSYSIHLVQKSTMSPPQMQGPDPVAGLSDVGIFVADDSRAEYRIQKNVPKQPFC
jgi:hypothetical protein